MKILILYSGGLDSYIMYLYAKAKYPNATIKAIYYDMGHGYAAKEKETLANFVEVKKIQWMEGKTNSVAKDGSNSGDIIIPGRNLLLATLGACQFMPDQIWLGALMGENHAGSTDKNELFVKLLNQTFDYVFSPFSVRPIIVCPFLDDKMSKLDIIRWALMNGVSNNELKATSSCLSSDMTKTNKCGKCVVCLRRWGIFYQCGFEEECDVHPVLSMSDNNIKMIVEMLKGEIYSDYQCHYDFYRRQEILPALSKYLDKSYLDMYSYYTERHT